MENTSYFFMRYERNGSDPCCERGTVSPTCKGRGFKCSSSDHMEVAIEQSESCDTTSVGNGC